MTNTQLARKKDTGQIGNGGEFAAQSRDEAEIELKAFTSAAELESSLSRIALLDQEQRAGRDELCRESAKSIGLIIATEHPTVVRAVFKREWAVDGFSLRTVILADGTEIDRPGIKSVEELLGHLDASVTDYLGTKVRYAEGQAVEITFDATPY